MAKSLKQNPVQDADGWAEPVKALTYDFLVDDKVRFLLGLIPSFRWPSFVICNMGFYTAKVRAGRKRGRSFSIGQSAPRRSSTRRGLQSCQLTDVFIEWLSTALVATGGPGE